MSTIVAGAAAALGLLYGPEQFRELILEPTINAPDLRQLFTIIDDIKAKKDVVFAKKFKKLSKLDTGCGTVPTVPGMNVEKLTWDPKPLEAWIAECGAEFEGTFMAWGLAAGYKRHDLQEASIKLSKGISDTPTLQNYWNEFVQDTMEEAIRDDIFRIGSFGDPAITAAMLTAGAADVPNYNQLRGIWPQIIALASTYASVRAYTITANQEAGQQLADGESRAIFRSLIVGADPRLMGGAFGQPIIACTQSVADNWADYRESNDKLETSWKLQETGLVGPKYRNVPVVPVQQWDLILQEDFNKAGVINLPHRAVLTTASNLQLGFDAYDEATQTEGWFNRETKYTHRRSNYKMDAKVMRPFLTRAAW